MRYHRLKITECHQGHFWRYSRPRAVVIHPIGPILKGKILKALRSTGIKADRERERAQCPASLPKNIYCQDIVPMAGILGREGNGVRKRWEDRTEGNTGLLTFFRKLMFLQLFTYFIDVYWIPIMGHTVIKKQTWSLPLCISPTSKMWNSQEQENLGGCRKRQRNNYFFECIYFS